MDVLDLMCYPRDVGTRRRVYEMAIKICPNSGTQSEAVLCADPRFVVVQKEARVADGRMCARAWPTGSCVLARGATACARGWPNRPVPRSGSCAGGINNKAWECVFVEYFL
jgi:hypothetical protein